MIVELCRWTNNSELWFKMVGYSSVNLLTNAKKKNGEMAQQLGTPLLPENLGQFSASTWQLTTVYNYSSRGSVHLT